MRSWRTNEKNNTLNLESDLIVTSEDILAQKKLSFHENISLEAYLDFLEDIGAFESKKPDPVIFSEVFTL